MKITKIEAGPPEDRTKFEFYTTFEDNTELDIHEAVVALKAIDFGNTLRAHAARKLGISQDGVLSTLTGQNSFDLRNRYAALRRMIQLSSHEGRLEEDLVLPVRRTHLQRLQFCIGEFIGSTLEQAPLMCANASEHAAFYERLFESRVASGMTLVIASEAGIEPHTPLVPRRAGFAP